MQFSAGDDESLVEMVWTL